MQNNQKSIKHVVAILSKLLSFLSIDEKEEIITKIMQKFDKYPSIELVGIWLQRLTIKSGYKRKYKSKLCNKVLDKKIEIWNNDWTNKEIKENLIINQNQLEKISSTISIRDVDLFALDDY